jgi:hypothetical protein
MQGKLKGGQISSIKESAALSGQSGSSFKPNRVHHTREMAEELGDSMIPGIAEISSLR